MSRCWMRLGGLCICELHRHSGESRNPAERVCATHDSSGKRTKDFNLDTGFRRYDEVSFV